MILEKEINDLTLLTKTTDSGKYRYSGYGIGLDEVEFFHYQIPMGLVRM